MDYKNTKCTSKISTAIEVNDETLKTNSLVFLNELYQLAGLHDPK